MLGYIGYAAPLLTPALLVLYWRNCPSSTQEKLKSISIYGGIAALLYAHQLLMFVTVHSANAGTQVRSLGRGLMGFGITQLSNQGVYPLSLGGLASAAGTSGLLALGLWSAMRHRQASGYFLAYWIGVASLLASGLAGKFRNFVTVTPLQGLWFSTLHTDLGNRTSFNCFLALAALGNCIGVFNVVTHQNTMKSNWNLPVPETLRMLDTAKSACAQDLLVLSHDRTLT